MKLSYYMVSALVPQSDAVPDMQLRALRRHVELAIPFIEQQQGHLLRETSDRIVVAFSDPIHAVLCAIRIQQVHRQNEVAPRPPSVRIVVFGSEFDGPSEEVVFWVTKWISSVGIGEIRVSESVATAWKTKGNRDLTSLPYDPEIPFATYLLRWQGPTREPVVTVRQRGWITVALVVLPSFVLLLLFWLQPRSSELPEADVWFVGPIWSNFRSVSCPNLHIATGRVVVDPELMFLAPHLLHRGQVKRLTGAILENNGRKLRIDVVDEMSGLLQARREIPCADNPCVCLQQLLDEGFGQESLQLPLQFACKTLLGDAALPQSIAICVQEYIGEMSGKDVGGTNP